MSVKKGGGLPKKPALQGPSAKSSPGVVTNPVSAYRYVCCESMETHLNKVLRESKRESEMKATLRAAWRDGSRPKSKRGGTETRLRKWRSFSSSARSLTFPLISSGSFSGRGEHDRDDA